MPKILGVGGLIQLPSEFLNFAINERGFWFPSYQNWGLRKNHTKVSALRWEFLHKLTSCVNMRRWVKSDAWKRDDFVCNTTAFLLLTHSSLDNINSKQNSFSHSFYFYHRFEAMKWSPFYKIKFNRIYANFEWWFSFNFTAVEERVRTQI